MQQPRYKEVKATQVAALLLTLRGGKMSYMKLIKLMYLVDRSALLEWGRPVTFDSYVSMPKGPVLSTTLDIISEGSPPGSRQIWNEYISIPKNYEVELKQECPTEELSEAEEELIHKVFKQFGHLTRWQLVDYLHENLPEWRDPQGSSIPIEYHDILRAGGKTEADSEAIESEMENLAFMNDMLYEFSLVS